MSSKYVSSDVCHEKAFLLENILLEKVKTLSEIVFFQFVYIITLIQVIDGLTLFEKI